MDPKAAIGARIVQLRRELQRLEAAARLLDGDEHSPPPEAPSPEMALPALPALPPAKAAIMRVLTEVGARGMRVSEVIAAVQKHADFTVGTIKQQLTMLGKDGLVTHERGVWRRA